VFQWFEVSDLVSGGRLLPLPGEEVVTALPGSGTEQTGRVAYTFGEKLWRVIRETLPLPSQQQRMWYAM
jgi:hypothetical protein